MNNRLRFNLELKSHPYSEEIGSQFEAWGYLSVSILASGNKISLLEVEWDLSFLAEWFIENKNFLRNETLSINKESLMPSESLAQALHRLQEREFSLLEEQEEEEWFDILFQFREHHSLRFALRGAKIPDIIIGCNHGVGEISLSNEEDDWSFLFDMDDFMHDLQKQLEGFLVQWLTSTQDITVRDRVDCILQRLRDMRYQVA